MIELLLAKLAPFAVDFVFTALGMAGTALISYGALYLRTNKNIIIADDKVKKLTNAVVNGINYAEELYENSKSSKNDLVPIPKTEKLKIATDNILENIKGVARDVIEKEVITHLAKSTNLGATANNIFTKVVKDGFY